MNYETKSLRSLSKLDNGDRGYKSGKYHYVNKNKYGPVWINITFFIYLHLISVYAIFTIFFYGLYNTAIFAYIYGMMAGLGVTAGAHRLWSHKSYKARLPLRTFLAVAFTIAGQNDLYTWCRDHRVHHKYSETDADPHNSKRGWFFAHMGWLLTKKHPDVIEKGSKHEMSDLWDDPVVRFQKRYYWPIFLFFFLILPTIIPMTFWREKLSNAIILNLFRYVNGLHGTWFVNSAAHMWGHRPYEPKIEPRENYFVSMGALGEGFHNYHHSFPWDYSTSELGWRLNFTKFFLDFMAVLGQVYDRKQLSRGMIISRKEKVRNKIRSSMH